MPGRRDGDAQYELGRPAIPDYYCGHKIVIQKHNQDRILNTSFAEANQWERERLDVLRRYQILDSDPEPAFDELTELAAYTLKVPMALISLVDEDRQWFKSCVGADLTETRREIAICSHAIEHENVFIIEDAREDPMFADNPLVTAFPNIVFYAGAPLIVEDGHRIGTLCIIDHKPRSLNGDEIKALKTMARLVVAQLDLRIAAMQQRQKAEGLQKTVALKDRFFSIIAHDLRTPFQTLMNLSQVLKTDQGEKNREMIADKLNRAAVAAFELTENLLKWAMLETHSVSQKPRSYRLTELIEETLAPLKATAEFKGVKLDRRLDDCRLNVDKVTAETLFRNLVSNAIKFSHPGGTVTISSQIDESGRCIAVKISDDGVGIEPERLAQIQQATDLDSSQGTSGEKGSGLGLMLCREFADRCGAKFELRSKPGQGTSVTLHFPVE